MKTDLETIQREALVAVETKPWDYTYRVICRWFSAAYFTPLQTVEMDLPEEYVLQHYFEHTFNERIRECARDETHVSVKEEWDMMRYKIIHGYAKVAEEEEIVAAEDDNWENDMKAMIAEEEAAAAKKPKKDPGLGDNGGGMLEVDPNDPNLFSGNDDGFEDSPPDY